MRLFHLSTLNTNVHSKRQQRDTVRNNPQSLLLLSSSEILEYIFGNMSKAIILFITIIIPVTLSTINLTTTETPIQSNENTSEDTYETGEPKIVQIADNETIALQPFNLTAYIMELASAYKAYKKQEEIEMATTTTRKPLSRTELEIRAIVAESRLRKLKDSIQMEQFAHPSTNPPIILHTNFVGNFSFTKINL